MIARGLRCGVGLLAAFSVTAVHAGSAFAWADDAAGPTCENHLNMGPLVWTNRGGDWRDGAGKPQGTLAYATRNLPEQAGRQRIELDVSALLRAVEPGVLNVTIALRAEPGPLRGQADFHSRESPDAGLRPELEIRRADGSRQRLTPAADTFLDCTSVSSLGRQPILSVRRDRSSLLRFEVDAAAASTIVGATLRLTSHRQYAGGATVGVYRADMPGERPPAPARLGLASRHLLDAGIRDEAAVLFATGFESRPWQLDWRDLTPRSNAEAVAGDPEQGFEPLDGRALRVRLLRGTHLALDLRLAFGRFGIADPEDLYLRYYLRFGRDWNPSADGGKLPGLAGTYGRGGWGNRRADGRNGWSMRAAFAPRPPGVESVRGLTALGALACHARIQDPNCEFWGWAQGPATLLGVERWVSIEQRVRMNTPGSADGIFEAWIDGVQVYRNTAVVYRDIPDLRIETAWFNVYHGGTEVAPADMTLYIDNVVVAREYIGPMAGVPVSGARAAQRTGR